MKCNLHAKSSTTVDQLSPGIDWQGVIHKGLFMTLSMEQEHHGVFAVMEKRHHKTFDHQVRTPSLVSPLRRNDQGNPGNPASPIFISQYLWLEERFGTFSVPLDVFLIVFEVTESTSREGGRSYATANLLRKKQRK